MLCAFRYNITLNKNERQGVKNQNPFSHTLSLTFLEIVCNIYSRVVLLSLEVRLFSLFTFIVVRSFNTNPL